MTRFSPEMSDPTPATHRDQDETVLAMDNIPLALPVAGIGSRALAATLDYVLVAVLATAWIFGLLYAGSRLQSRVGSAWTFAIALLGLFALEYGYFAGVEAVTGGRSLVGGRASSLKTGALTTRSRWRRFGVLLKSTAFLLWTLWGVLQVANNNPRPAYHFESFWDYAMDRFTRCQQIMNADNFGKLVEAVRKGT